MPKTASALLVVPYQKFPTNKPSPTNHLKKPGSLRPLSFPCPESDESLASNASASFLASTEDTLSSLLSNSLTRIRVDAFLLLVKNAQKKAFNDWVVYID